MQNNASREILNSELFSTLLALYLYRKDPALSLTEISIKKNFFFCVCLKEPITEPTQNLLYLPEKKLISYAYAKKLQLFILYKGKR